MKKLVLILLVYAALEPAYAQPNPPPPARHSFIVISHRGDHVKCPENTLAGYAEAIKNEADYIEIDLRTTKDGELVSMHDGTVNRMTEGKGNVKDLTLAEMEQLHVKSKDSLDKDIYRVPTFKQILGLCKDKIYIYIDYKNADAAVTYAMLKEYGMEKQVLVYINNPQQFVDWRKIAPGMPLMVSMPGNVKDEAGMKAFIDKVKPDILDGGWKEYTPAMVASARAMGLTVWPDIQSANESQNWDEALAKGFNGLQTDHPADLVRFLKSKGLR
ncbi:glycerophosphodiester phosphodiesterase family protein [Mucilaginibacter ginsenosidivorans]|uniref:Glycerophosphodiester phosphodiesterase family protein n=1 Tax=Mucilaginibacter ginsenosidivorans TaxID=398053 RepID=A0A5B8UZF4_9SPHI|nr:glycerophosphodiester phosphodiesterase family protein [Mucilaginibacter ginsenosidivorans]QEC64597.1 glycerophosphodiester phosphodiesterase family protein [Mucilaginibacter ginsenosidivorans]